MHGKAAKMTFGQKIILQSTHNTRTSHFLPKKLPYFAIFPKNKNENCLFIFVVCHIYIQYNKKDKKSSKTIVCVVSYFQHCKNKLVFLPARFLHVFCTGRCIANVCCYCMWSTFFSSGQGHTFCSSQLPGLCHSSISKYFEKLCWVYLTRASDDDDDDDIGIKNF